MDFFFKYRLLDIYFVFFNKEYHVIMKIHYVLRLNKETS